MFKVSGPIYRRGLGVQLSGLFFMLLMAIAGTGITNAYGITYDLTTTGLGVSPGNHGYTLAVPPELTLSALTKGSELGYPNGLAGTIYLHPTDGTGVQNESAQGSKGIDGAGNDAYESLIFDFSVAVDAQQVTIWLNKYDQPYVDLWVKPFSGSAIQVPYTSVSAYFHSTSGDQGYVNFSELPELSGVGCIVRIIAKAVNNSHFYIDRLDVGFCSDGDSDGYPADSDCDDNDPNINPGATEICNGIDDNCDGDVDEGCTIYYLDADGDGYGDPSNWTTGMSPPFGYVANSSDCDDSRASVHPGASEACNGIDDDCDGNIDEGCTTYYRDADSDTYGDPDDSIIDTSQPEGYVANSGDCDDTDFNVYPGATEACNSFDDDCDGHVDEGCSFYYRDADGDTYGDPGDSTTDTSQPPGYVANAGDCDDSNASINPGATEICNGVDDNCFAGIDEGCTTYYQDADGDGYGNPAVSTIDTSQPSGYVDNSSDCDDSDFSINPGATELCNGVDDNCFAGIDEGCTTYYRDADGDGYGNPAVSTTDTSQPPGYVDNSNDCDDTRAGVHPGATEACNGIDDDCDMATDEGCMTYYLDADGDGYGDLSQPIVATSPPAGYVANSADCDDTNANIYPGASEICNGLDDDCDGTVDEGCLLYYRDNDGDGYGDPAVSSTVSQPGYVANSGDCDDSDFSVNPGATELCNGVDDNCFGGIDEGCTTYYEDADGDGYGNPGVSVSSPAPPPGYVANSGDCDDTNSNIHPGATELCNNLRDDDCDGYADENCALVVDIPPQTVRPGEPFPDIYLDDHISLPPGYNPPDVDWTTSGGVRISVEIDSNRVAHISYPHNWTGSEMITFTATVNPSGSQTVTFTVLAGSSGGGGGGITVGGVVVPVDKFALVAPWIGFFVLIMALVGLLIARKQKRGSTRS